MAWISVHETVMSAKLRKLAKAIGCSQNEALGVLTRLWLWGIRNADKYGNIVEADKEDIEDVLSVGLAHSIEPEHVVQCLIDIGYIEDVDGRLKFHNWDIWQVEWYKLMENRQKWREDYKKKKEMKNTGNTEETEPPKRIKKKNDYPEDFEKFWQVYPRRIGKGEAYKCYKARVNDGWSPENLVQAAERYALQVEKMHTEEKYIKHPKTFLSASTPFTDYIEDQNEDLLKDTIDRDKDIDLMKDWR